MPHKDIVLAHNELKDLLVSNKLMTAEEFDFTVVLLPSREMATDCACCQDGDGHHYHIEFTDSIPEERQAQIGAFLAKNPLRKVDAR